MEVINLLHLTSRSELRQWLEENHNEEKCCWVVTYRGKRPEWSAIPYFEVVEEALCFGWIYFAELRNFNAILPIIDLAGIFPVIPILYRSTAGATTLAVTGAPNRPAR